MNHNIIDLHMHSTASDGSDSPKELTQNIYDLGIRVFSLTDHDTIAGCEEIVKYLPDHIIFIPGIEFSCRSEVAKCHILGYGYNAKNPDFEAAIAEGRQLRMNKLSGRLDWLKNQFGIEFDTDELSYLHSLTSVGKPHLASLLVKHGYANTITEAIQSYLKGLYEKNDRISAEMGIKAILSAGGTPVWAHPLGGEGEKRITPERFEAQLDHLISLGIQGMECYYSRYTREEEAFLVETATEHGLKISAGSDYHGKNKTVRLGELCADGDIISREQITLLP